MIEVDMPQTKTECPWCHCDGMEITHLDVMSWPCRMKCFLCNRFYRCGPVPFSPGEMFYEEIAEEPGDVADRFWKGKRRAS